jgi:hypothetical protein
MYLALSLEEVVLENKKTQNAKSSVAEFIIKHLVNL